MNKRKTVIITGGGTGIGLATALRFSRDGYNVVLNGRNRDPLDAAAKQMPQGRSAIVVADISQEATAAAIVSKAVETFGGVDVLVNDAGVVIPGSAETLPDAAFEEMMAVNVGGLRRLSIAALPELRKTKGNIVNVSSVSGMRGDWGMYGYNASKGAVNLLTQGLALELARDQVRVNAVAPVTTNTRLATPLKSAPQVMQALQKRIPMGRLVEPEEVAGVIAFLAGPDAAFVTGVILPVDGGLTASNGQPNFFDP